MKVTGLLIAAIMTLWGCSDLTGGNQKSSDEAEESEANAEETTEEESAPPSETDGGEDVLTRQGMPEHCTLDVANSRGCFSCKPRTLPLLKCVDVPTDFDAANECTHDLQTLSCDSANFAWDFDDIDKVEKIYEYMPLIDTVLKAIVAKKFKDKPDLVTNINKVIDFVMAKKLEIFTGTKLDEVAKGAVALAKEIRPDLTLDEKQMEQTISAALAVFEEQRKNGDMSEADLFQMLTAMFGGMPLEMDGLLQELDGASIEKLLFGGGGGTPKEEEGGKTPPEGSTTGDDNTDSGAGDGASET